MPAPEAPRVLPSLRDTGFLLSTGSLEVYVSHDALQGQRDLCSSSQIPIALPWKKGQTVLFCSSPPLAAAALSSCRPVHVNRTNPWTRVLVVPAPAEQVHMPVRARDGFLLHCAGESVVTGVLATLATSSAAGRPAAPVSGSVTLHGSVSSALTSFVLCSFFPMCVLS